jgi:hypothetical protein
MFIIQIMYLEYEFLSFLDENGNIYWFIIYKLMKITLHIVIFLFVTMCSVVGWYQRF